MSKRLFISVLAVVVFALTGFTQDKKDTASLHSLTGKIVFVEDTGLGPFYGITIAEVKSGKKYYFMIPLENLMQYQEKAGSSTIVNKNVRVTYFTHIKKEIYDMMLKSEYDNSNTKTKNILAGKFISGEIGDMGSYITIKDPEGIETMYNGSFDIDVENTDKYQNKDVVLFYSERTENELNKLTFINSLPVQNNKELTGFYSGKLGKNLAITVSLKQSGNEINGFYHYDKNNIDIHLLGKIGPSGSVRLEELGYFEVTGYWEGKLTGNQFIGIWTNANNKKTLPFKCEQISLKGIPGEPTSDKVAFGESIIELECETTQVPADLAKILYKEMVDDGSIDEELEYNKDVVKKGKENPSILFSADKIDLNSDTVPELIVYPSGEGGACTAHNCFMWIHKYENGKLVRILRGVMGIGGYLVLSGKSVDYHDIALIQHASAIEHEYEVFRFDGKEYKLTNCITETAIENNNGAVNFKFKEHICGY